MTRAASLLRKARLAAENSSRIEVISVPAILGRPRYRDGFYLDSRLHWKRRDDVALAALCEAAADLGKSAEGLGRTPKILCNRAKDTGLKLPPEWWDHLYPDRVIRRAERERLREQRALEREKKRKAERPRIAIAYPYI